MKNILNLTQHETTQDQILAGVFEPDPEQKKTIQKLLTVEVIPTAHNLKTRAAQLAEIAWDLTHGDTQDWTNAVMIGGAPFLMSYLEKALQAQGLQPLYSFSKRVVTELEHSDGTVEKKAVFKHVGWVEAFE
jgi:hypothetical protein